MRILVADDHELFRDGLQLVLHELGPQVEVIQSSTYAETLACVGFAGDSGPPVEVVLLDLVMPGMPWTDGLRTLKERRPAMPVVVLSASEDRRLVLEAVRLGASGFIPKTSSARVMLSALRLVLSGGVYLPPTLIDERAAQSLIAPETFCPDFPAEATETADDDSSDHNGSNNRALSTALTPRQREVLTLLGQGKSNKEIARTLALSEGTVKLHVTAILKALNVNNRTGAVVAAARLGLTPS